jgi:SnoaL-like polyketide cyclase
MLQAMPDLHIDIRRRHASEDAIIVEAVIRGRHLGTWRALHATGRQMEFPLCGIFTFDEGNRVAGEKIYYDRATPLGQLGCFTIPRACVGESPPHLRNRSRWRTSSREKL